jgi:hypothetical protein
MKRLLHTALVFAVLRFAPAGASTRTIDLEGPGLGVTHAGFAKAIAQAKRTFAQEPDATVEVRIGPGTFDLSETRDARGVIDVTGVHPGEHGRLVIRGAGPGKTTLVFDKGVNWIFGRDVFHVSFIGLRLASKQPTVSQGHVVSVGASEVVLDIQDGFPSPGELFNPKSNQGRYLRRYADSRTDPKLDDTEPQVPWNQATQVSGARWRFELHKRWPIDVAGRIGWRDRPDWKPGDLIGIKSKPPGNVFWFFGGSDIAFEDIEWVGRSRGTFRGGIGHVHIARNVVNRGPPVHGQTPCLSTPGGGPQLGNPGDPPSEDDLVEDSRYTATGDDAIAFFSATGTARNNFVTDSFCRGILLYKSPAVKLEKNEVVRCPIVPVSNDSQSGSVPLRPAAKDAGP